MKYEIQGFIKLSEQDNFENGCCVKAQESYFEYPIKADTVESLKEKLKNLFGDDAGIDFNACEEQGRIDIQITENDDGLQPTIVQWEQFKAGEIDLWAVTYTAYCETVTLQPAQF